MDILCNRNFNSSFAVHSSQKAVSGSILEKGLCEIMKNEINRLNSFNGKWPLDFIAMNDLAKCGFFYLLSDDKVQCAFCELILAQWKVGDEPLDQHKKYSSKCRFLSSSKKVDPKRNIGTSNFNYIYTPLLNVSNPQRAKIPRMSDANKRLSTYKEWPKTIISIEDLAACGLFYTGVDDVVTCFSCGVSLSNWEPGDEPMAKHSKLYPNCIFLHFVISTSILEKRKMRKPLNIFPELMLKPPTPSLTVVLKSEIVHMAKDIFPSQLVEEVVCTHLKETGKCFSSLQHLCDKVLEYEEKKLKIRLSTTPKEREQPCTSEVSIKTGYNDLKSAKEALLCKICLTEELAITFQPCGHFISCDLCSQRVSRCPICRLPVQNRIKTYLS